MSEGHLSVATVEGVQEAADRIADAIEAVGIRSNEDDLEAIIALGVLFYRKLEDDVLEADQGRLLEWVRELAAQARTRRTG